MAGKGDRIRKYSMKRWCSGYDRISWESGDKDDQGLSGYVDGAEYYVDRGLSCVYMIIPDGTVLSIGISPSKMMADRKDIEKDPAMEKVSGQEALKHIVKELKQTMRMKDDQMQYWILRNDMDDNEEYKVAAEDKEEALEQALCLLGHRMTRYR